MESAFYIIPCLTTTNNNNLIWHTAIYNALFTSLDRRAWSSLTFPRNFPCEYRTNLYSSTSPQNLISRAIVIECDRTVIHFKAVTTKLVSSAELTRKNVRVMPMKGTLECVWMNTQLNQGSYPRDDFISVKWNQDHWPGMTLYIFGDLAS